MTEDKKILHLMDQEKLSKVYHPDITLDQLLKALPKMSFNARERRVLQSRLDYNKRRNDKSALAEAFTLDASGREKNAWGSFKKNRAAVKLLHSRIDMPRVQKTELNELLRRSQDPENDYYDYMIDTIDRRINDKDLRKIVRALPDHYKDDGNYGDPIYFRQSFALDGIGSVFPSDYTPGPHINIRKEWEKLPRRRRQSIGKQVKKDSPVLLGLGALSTGAMAYLLKRKGQPLKSWKSVAKLGTAGLAVPAAFIGARMVQKHRARRKKEIADFETAFFRRHGGLDYTMDGYRGMKIDKALMRKVHLRNAHAKKQRI